MSDGGGGWLPSVIGDDRVRELLATNWGLPGAAVAAHHGGMNSATWWVEHDGQRYVAKHAYGGFVGGMAVAAYVQEAGIPTGAPVPTLDHRLVVDLGDGAIALLRFVPGGQPALDDDGLRLIGETLGRVHLVLKKRRLDGAHEMVRPDPDADYVVAAPPWVRSGIRRALTEYDALDPATLTHGMLHTDPAPEAFLVDPDTGAVALIDWATACYGPLLYDVASAVMYVGGPDPAQPLLCAYVATGALGSDELTRGLAVLRRYRWAVQAWYFAHRIAADDMTGIDSPAENLKGLLDARPHLED